MLAYDQPINPAKPDGSNAPPRGRADFSVLELANLCTDSGLRTITRLSGLREALQANNFEKCVDLIEIHGTRPLESGGQLPPV